MNIRYNRAKIDLESRYFESRIKDQGSNGRRKRFRLERKSPFSAYSRPQGQQAVEYQRKYCRKMQTKKEKQKKQHTHR